MEKNLHTAVPDNHGTCSRAQELRRGRSDVPDVGHPENGPEVRITFLCKLPVLKLLHPERLHHLDPRYRLMHHRGQIRDSRLGQTALVVDTAANPGDHEEHEGKDDEGNQRQLPADAQRDGEIDDDQEGFPDHRLESRRHPRIDNRDVIHDPRDQVPGPLIREISKGEFVDVPVQGVPQIARESLLNVDHQVGLDIPKDVLDEECPHHHQTDIQEGIGGIGTEDHLLERPCQRILGSKEPPREERRPCRSRGMGGGVPGEQCLEQRDGQVDRDPAEDREEDRTDDREDQRKTVGPDIGKDANVDVHRIRRIA